MTDMSDSVRNALCDQIGHELTNSAKYLSMCAWAEYQGLQGFSKFLRAQAEGERDHADMVANFLMQRGQLIHIPDRPSVNGSFNNIDSLMSQVVETEEGTTEALVNCYELAQSEGDLMAFIFLQPMITEQVEEEDVTHTLLDRVRMAGSNTAALLVLDHQLQE